MKYAVIFGKEKSSLILSFFLSMNARIFTISAAGCFVINCFNYK